MYEVERKMRVPHAIVRDPLADVEGQFVATVRQRDTYFDHPVRDFTTTDEALRVREQRVESGEVDAVDRLTYKGPRLDTAEKTRIERETTLGDPDIVVGILETLDFPKAGVVDKTRERYEIARCTLCLDTVAGLGEFVEVEAGESFEDVDSASDAIATLVETLGIGGAEPIDSSYLAMVLERGNPC